MMKIKNCNWPEFTSYCGCCKLSTGIYIRSGLSVLVLMGLSVLVVFNMTRLLSLRKEFHDMANQTVLVGYLDLKVSPANYDSVMILFKTIIFFHIFWVSFRLLYIIKTLALCYAIYKSNVGIVKVLLHISIPCCILDIVLSILGFFLFRHVLKIVMVIFYLSEGYNLLAVYSVYKRISGTSRIIRKEDIGDPNVGDSLRSITTPANAGFPFRGPHCQSCTCFLLDNVTNSENVETTNVVPRYRNTVDNDIERNLQNDLVERSNEQADEGCLNIDNNNETAAGEIPDCLDLSAEKKTDLADTPVIYDEEQLQTSGNLVIEDR